MTRQFAILLLLASSAAAQMSTFTIKGHALGETAQELFANSAKPSQPEECREYVRSHKAKESLLTSPKQMDINSEIRRCSQILLAITGQRAKFFFKELMGDVQFDSGKLTAIEITFMNSILPASQQVSFAKILEDAIVKYGEPKDTGTTTWQNGFGATFNPRYVEWTNDLYALRIEELPKQDPYHLNADVVLSARTKAELANRYKDKVSGPNVFDSRQP